ncbi:MAG TPA: GNAT family N-acetyltransferase [Polyangiaceae bacterium]|jgi:ribosomal protein S18 acetylase RimI-like enzyme|nr:GNAT family N-acetyltransferase [Polyangiaceae bacterium]
MITQRRLAPEDRPRIVALLGSTSAFTPDEQSVALELVDASLNRPDVDEYRFILSFWTTPGEATERLAGYLCYGRTPMTTSTYDLYWIATSPDFARSGIASGLVATMEAEIAREGGGLVRVETGSREGHGAAVHFYDAIGFTRAAVIDDFYAPGDDLLIFTKRIRREGAPSAPATDFAALYDAAFSYRDYAAERDFLLACIRRFGSGDVRRVLEWACGPARHLAAFAELGIAGVGTDGSQVMIDYARRTFGARPGISFERADLDERLLIAPVDLSFVPLSSIHQLTTPEALRRHLLIAASLLRPGGVHVIEATHPSDLLPTGVNLTKWTEVRGDQVIDARFRMHVDRATPDRVIPVTLEVVCSSKRSGQPSSPAPKASTLRQEDLWFIPDLAGWHRVIAEVPDFKLAGALGDFNVDVPFERPEAWRLILVLKRA